MKYPKNLKVRDTIAVIATSSGLKEYERDNYKEICDNLKKRGYNVFTSPNVFTNSNFVSSSGRVRAKIFHELIKNNKISVISQVRGGELLLEMIPYLDDKIIKNNQPKWIFGYSDASLLNFYLTTKFDIATINSLNILKFNDSLFSESIEYIFNTLKDDYIEEKSFKYYFKNKKMYKVKYKNLYNEKNVVIKGRLIGGCLEAITEILGTKYDYMEDYSLRYKEGILWYLDIYDSNPLDLYRTLLKMKWANWFNNINGVIIGRTNASKKIGKLTYKEVLHKIFDSINVSVIYDVDIGHTKPQFSIINGALGTFIYQNGKGLLIQEKK